MKKISMLQVGYKFVRRLVIFAVGISVLFVGIAMIVLPGPAIIVVPLGLAILATEFVWAKIMLKKFKEKSTDGARTIKDWFFNSKKNT